jgi:protein ImuB
MQPPNELALEVRGSVRLFGGIAAFLDRVRSDFKQRGLDPQIAMSSTANSSLWLSRTAQEPRVVQPRDLTQSISRLPISVLLWPADIELRLIRFGVLTIGDLLRLPRGGLARRIGYEHLAELDRAIGRHPEVRHYFSAAETYDDPVALDFEIETTSLLSTIVEKRLRQLQTFLTRRNLSLDSIGLQLRHRDQRVTPVILGLASPTADMEHVTQLMREQLARVQLPAPVIAFSITVERLHPAPQVTHELFNVAGAAHTGIARSGAQARLLEQLRSRLGDSAISRVQTHADYRPECAHHAASPNLQSENVCEHLPIALAPRPMWLLSEPRDISAGALRNAPKVGPEKIETGWWDDQFAVRDYYRVASPHGALGWVYMDHLRSCRWLLHGLFG